MDAVSIKQLIYQRISKYLKNIGISPNLITLFTLLTMLFASYLVIIDNLTGAGIFILISGVLDFLDGAVAKAKGQVTQFGALLDRVTDRASDFLVMASLIATGYAHLILGLVVLLTVPLASYISACIEAAKGSTVGERLSMRAVRIVILALACFTYKINEAMLLLAAVGTYSVAKRLVIAYRLLR
jgi:archaetidylinositol phosphate synthase